VAKLTTELNKYRQNENRIMIKTNEYLDKEIVSLIAPALSTREFKDHILNFPRNGIGTEPHSWTVIDTVLKGESKGDAKRRVTETNINMVKESIIFAEKYSKKIGSYSKKLRQITKKF